MKLPIPTSTLPIALALALASCMRLAAQIAVATPTGDPPSAVSIYRTINPSVPSLALWLAISADSVSIDRIEISSGGTVIQTIEEPGMDDLFFDQNFSSENLEFMVRTEDITFDGYADLWLMQWRGAHEVGYAYWLYNPKSGKFEYYKPISGECGYPDIDSVAKTMSLRCNTGAAGAYYIENMYRFSNGRFTLIRQEIQDSYGSKYDKVERIVKELRKGKLRVASRKVMKMEDLENE
jgi:hypothetical protein